MELVGFIGKATVSIDTAGRTNLPRELRKQLPMAAKGKVVITIFAGRSLALRPLPEWNRYVTEELEPRARQSTRDSLAVQRVTAMAKLCELDAQNRISLTPELSQYAGIGKEVTFAGDGARIRMWDPAAFERMMSEAEAGQGLEEWFFAKP